MLCGLGSVAQALWLRLPGSISGLGSLAWALLRVLGGRSLAPGANVRGGSGVSPLMTTRLVTVLSVLALTMACRNADLVVVSGPPKVDLAETGVPGGSMRLGPWILRNQGTASTAAAGGWFSNGYYLSTDPVITTEDRQLRGLTDTDTADLAPGQSYTVAGDQEIVIPEDVKPGTYYFGILVDRSNRVQELDETNNAVSVRIGIVKEPEE